MVDTIQWDSLTSSFSTTPSVIFVFFAHRLLRRIHTQTATPQIARADCKSITDRRSYLTCDCARFGRVCIYPPTWFVLFHVRLCIAGAFQRSASTIIRIDERSSAAASTASSNRPAGCGRVNTSTPRPATSNCLFIGAPDSISGLVYHLCANSSSSVTKWSLLARSRTTWISDADLLRNL